MRILRTITVVLVTLILVVSLMPFGFFVTIKTTVLNPHFLIRAINGINILDVTDYYLSAYLPEDIKPYQPAIHLTVEQNQSWIKGQIQTIILDSYNFLLSRTEEWSISVKTEGIIYNLIDNLMVTFEQSPTPEYTILDEAEQKIYLLELRSQIKDAIPASISVDRNDIPQDIWSSILRAREIIRYINLAYYGLIVVLILMIISLFLLYLNVKIPSRILGIVFAFKGLVGVICFIVIRRVLATLVPAEILLLWQPYLALWMKDLLMPWGIFYTGLLIAGVGLLTISFLVRKQVAAIK